MLFNPKTTPVHPADTKLTWCSIYILFRSSKSTGDIHSNTYRKFLLFLITRFSKYICNQVPVKVTATFIYLDYNEMWCAFSAKSLTTVWRSPFCSVSFYWPSSSCHQWRWTVILWLAFISFPFTITPIVCNPKRIHILSHLLLFISRFTVTAKQIFPFFLLSILFSFFFLFLTIRYNIFLPFVRFLWSSVTIWFFTVGKDSYLFCSCQQKGALLRVPVTEGTTVTLKLFSDYTRPLPLLKKHIHSEVFY